MLSFVNDHFIDAEKATIGVGDLALQRGYGVFDFFRTANAIPLFLDDYLDRFLHSAKGLRLQSPKTKDELIDIIDELIRRNGQTEAGFRMILTGGYSPDSFEPADPNLVIIQQPLQLPTIEKFEKGLKILLHEYMRDLPSIKSINYLVGIHAREKIVAQQVDDVLYYKDDLVLEFPRSNVFIVTKDQTIVTPAANVLPGITRKKVIELAKEKYAVEVREVNVEELRNAAEVFLTSTTKRIMPVSSIDDVIYNHGKPGTITTALFDQFLSYENSIINKS